MFNKVKIELLREEFERATNPFDRERVESCSGPIQEMIAPILDALYYDTNDYKPSYEITIATVDMGMGINHLKAKRFNVLLRAAEILMVNAKKKLEEEALTYNWLVLESMPDPPPDRLGFQIVLGINQKPALAT